MSRILRVRVRFLSADAGGRTTLFPDMLSRGIYRPHFVVEDPAREPETALGIEFVGQDQPLVAGQDVMAEVRLIYAGVDYSALKKDAVFTIREAGRIVGNGTVIEVSER